MRSLIVQLSDIHLRDTSNSVLARRRAIVEALRNLEPNAQCCLLLLTGDVAFSGKDSEYMIAYEFIETLKFDLRAELMDQPPVYVAVIPGNHDCYFGEDQAARNLIRDGLVKSLPEEIEPSVIEVCTDVQRHFFGLRESISDSDTLIKSGRLYYEYRIPVGGEYIEVRCLNTAWLSQLREGLGSLYFPVSLISNRNPAATLTISVLHHPFGWFPPENRRALQQRLEEVSDIIFTGHEHAHSRRTQFVSTGEINEFIEGTALQSDIPAESSFNALVVDTAAREQRFFRFEWADSLYETVLRGEWEPFQVNKLRARGEFQVSAKLLSFLDDAGAAFEKSGHGRVKLGDVFVFPELRKLSSGADSGPALKGKEILDDSIETPHLLISGSEQSGKTSLAKMVFLHLRQKGLVPLFIDGATFSPQKGGRLHEQLYRAFPEQYDQDALEAYRQLERPRRVVIVDNFHKVSLRPGGSEQFLTDLESFAGRILLLTNDLAYAMGEIAKAGQVIHERSDYSHFRILPFGYAKRSELTAKWFMLPGNIDDQELARRLTDAEDRMEVVLGKNFVPAFPIFILAMLQGIDSVTEVDVNASTYGYFYELLIKAALLRGSTQQEFNIRVTYLTRLAFHMFSARRRDITDTELRVFHAEYERATDLPTSYNELIKELQDRLILVRHADTYEFKYDYCYYYFVARHLQRTISDNATRKSIGLLSQDLTSEESSNILLFLAHLTDDDLVIDAMLDAAARYYPDITPAKLDDDIAFLNELAATDSLELEYEEKDYLEARHELARARDEMARSQEHATPSAASPSDDELREYQRLVAELQAALKTLEILGQVVKNHPALNAEKKEAILVACYSLGFRALTNMLKLLEDGRSSIVELTIEALRSDKPNMGEEKLKVAANSVVFSLGLLGSYGVVKRVSMAVGSHYLEKTYAKVLKAMPTNAAKLVNMSVRLDQIRGFPRGDIIRLNEDFTSRSLPKGVLKWLVWTHVNLFPVSLEDRQKVFASLDIKYSPRIGANPARRLLAPGRGKD